jgi:hypothetical protein
VLLWLGPYQEIYTPFNSFAHFNHYQGLHHAREPRTDGRIHCDGDGAINPFYARVPEDTPALVFWPAPDALFGSAVSYARAQSVHRRPVKVLGLGAWSPEVKLRGRVGLPVDKSAEPGTYFVLQELAEVGPEADGTRKLSATQYPKLAQALRRRLGPPVVWDEEILVFRVPPERKR